MELVDKTITIDVEVVDTQLDYHILSRHNVMYTMNAVT